MGDGSLISLFPKRVCRPRKICGGSLSRGPFGGDGNRHVAGFLQIWRRYEQVVPQSRRIHAGGCVASATPPWI